MKINNVRFETVECRCPISPTFEVDSSFGFNLILKIEHEIIEKILINILHRNPEEKDFYDISRVFINPLEYEILYKNIPLGTLYHQIIYMPKFDITSRFIPKAPEYRFVDF